MIKKYLSLGLFALSLITLIISTNSSVKASPKYDLSSTTSVSTWLWNTDIIKYNQEGYIDYMSSNNVKTVYVAISYDLNIKYYKDFIGECSKVGIETYGLFGSYTNLTNPTEVLDYIYWINNYNSMALSDEKIKGLALDTEMPCVDDTTEMFQMQQVLTLAKQEAQLSNLKLELDASMGYNEKYYDNSFGSGRFSEWLVQNVDILTLMAYRTTSSEIIQQSQDWVSYAELYGKKVKIAVETQDITPKSVTFFGKSNNNMYQVLNEVDDYYQSSMGYQGLAIHNLITWMDIIQNDNSERNLLVAVTVETASCITLSSTKIEFNVNPEESTEVLNALTINIKSNISYNLTAQFREDIPNNTIIPVTGLFKVKTNQDTDYNDISSNSIILDSNSTPSGNKNYIISIDSSVAWNSNPGNFNYILQFILTPD